MGQLVQIDDVYFGWMSVFGVGGLLVVEGFFDFQMVVIMMMDCFVSFDYYVGYIGEKEICLEVFIIDGYLVWWKCSEVYVLLFSLFQVCGDVVDVVVVNMG